MDTIPACDLIILAVPDDKITDTSLGITDVQIPVVHTSGSVDVHVLSRFNNYGVFYFPQTFSVGRAVDFSKLTICLEASNEATMKQLELLGNSLSRKRKHINSQQRRQLHLAAVYMNNFVNHCYFKSAEILDQNSMSSDLLLPLMQETFEKASELGAKKSQTGPARRGDEETIKKHLQLLDTTNCEMYQAISTSIKLTYETKL